MAKIQYILDPSLTKGRTVERRKTAPATKRRQVIKKPDLSIRLFYFLTANEQPSIFILFYFSKCRHVALGIRPVIKLIRINTIFTITNHLAYILTLRTVYTGYILIRLLLCRGNSLLRYDTSFFVATSSAFGAGKRLLSLTSGAEGALAISVSLSRFYFGSYLRYHLVHLRYLNFLRLRNRFLEPIIYHLRRNKN